MIDEILRILLKNEEPVKESRTLELSRMLEAFQCGESLASLLPSLIYFVGVVLLVQHVIIINIRPQMYRRLGRQLLLQIPWQEILITALIYQCVKIWLCVLVLMDGFFSYYQTRLTVLCPKGLETVSLTAWHFTHSPLRLCHDLIRLPVVIFHVVFGHPSLGSVSLKDIGSLHPLVQIMLVPNIIKLVGCTFLSVLPAIILFKLRDNHHLPPFMLWLGPTRRDRSELGVSSYYLERPISSESLANSSNDSVDLKKSNSTGDVEIVPPSIGPRRLRPRKSASM